MTKQDECPICLHEKCDVIERDIASEELSKRAIAAELEIPLEVVWVHMNEHYGQVSVSKCYKDHGDMDESTIESLYGKKKVLEDIIMKLKDRVDGLCNTDSLKPMDTSNIMKTAQVLLKAVELLARLEGDFQEEKKITLEMYVSLKSAVLVATQDHPEVMEQIISNVKVVEQKAIRALKVEIPKELTIEVGENANNGGS